MLNCLQFKTMYSLAFRQSKLIAIFVQSCLWGTSFMSTEHTPAYAVENEGGFAVMFVITYWILVYNLPFNRPLNKSMLGVAILMFVLATMVSFQSRIHEYLN